jgi:hypothetical protein
LSESNALVIFGIACCEILASLTKVFQEYLANMMAEEEELTVTTIVWSNIMRKSTAPSPTSKRYNLNPLRNSGSGVREVSVVGLSFESLSPFSESCSVFLEARPSWSGTNEVWRDERLSLADETSSEFAIIIVWNESLASDHCIFSFLYGD